jgi:hypothetical protein
MRGDANGGVAEAGVEDVGAVSGRGHPGGDDRTGCGLPERAPANVLTDFVADLRVGDVAAGAHAAKGGCASWPIMFEIVSKRHALGVSLGGLLESFVGRQRPLALTGPFPVDQADGGGANAAEVFLGGPQVGAGARARDVAGRYVPLGETTDRGSSRRSHGKQSHEERYEELLVRRPLPPARAGVTGMATIIKRQQKRVADGYYPHKHNLFRWPTGLADGLALKEPALPTASP